MKLIQAYLLISYFAAMSFTGCNNKKLPVLVTSEIHDITSSSAICGGEIIVDGGEQISSKGVCWKNAMERWGMPQEPTVNDNKVITGTGPGNYSAEVSNLEPGTTYYVRAFAINENGIGYGPEKTFKTKGALPIVAVKQAANITASTVEFEGLVNPANITTEVYFEYGATRSYGKKAIVTPSSLYGDLPLKVKVNVGGLLSGTTYHFRLKAENALGSIYSQDMTFKTADNVFDIDGNSYDVVTIGDGEWLKQNLKTTRYRDGSVIKLVSNDLSWSSTDSGAYCSYNKKNEFITSNGALYNWYAVMDPRGLCPAGWHVPTNEELIELVTFLGGPEIAGGKMKANGTLYWSESGSAADNCSNFSAQGSGFRDQTGIFAGHMEIAYFWSSTEYSHTHGISRKLYYDNPMISFSGNFKKSGFSVRCIKDR